MKIICFEGSDACGKATQSKMFANSCNVVGWRAKRVEIPYNDKFTYKLIYKLINSKKIKNYQFLFQVLQILNKFLFQIFNWKKLEKDYDVLVLDRWKMSTEAFGKISDVTPLTWKFSNWLLKNPTLTIIFWGESYNKKDLDEYEKDDEFQLAVKYRYLELSEHYGKDSNINNTHGIVEFIDIRGLSIEEVQIKVHDIVIKHV